jgi:biopolymer transport protein ExbD
MASSPVRDEDELAEAHEINVTPFIDVMLVLLIIFMVAAPLATVDVRVDLPSSTATPAPRPNRPLSLTVAADKTLRVGDSIVCGDQLAAALDAGSGGDREAPLFLYADSGLAYGTLMEVMDRVRAAGYRRVALVGTEETR